MYIDTHAHLNLDAFADDLHEVIERAHSAGVDAIVNIGVDLPTSDDSIKLAEQYEFMYAAAGIHPNDAATATTDDVKQIESMLSHPKVVALGEIGLDYYRDYTPAEKQREILHEQLELAIEKQIPIIVHTRNAWHDIFSIFEGEYNGKLSGVFHCFSGDKSDMNRVINLGFHVSFTGVLTFKNSRAIDIAKAAPIERLLLETDCPFMAPTPHRGKRCEPAYVPLIAECIADAKKIDVKTLAQVTTMNAKALFGIL